MRLNSLGYDSLGYPSSLKHPWNAWNVQAIGDLTCGVYSTCISVTQGVEPTRRKRNQTVHSDIQDEMRSDSQRDSQRDD